MSIRHNATYLPVKSDLRSATAEETIKYKDANKHGHKKAADTASTGEASASCTTMEPEGAAETNKGGEPRRSRGDSAPAIDKDREKKRGRAKKGRDEKNVEPRKDSSRDDARKAKETADEKDAAEDEADKMEYLALQSKM